MGKKVYVAVLRKCSLARSLGLSLSQGLVKNDDKTTHIVFWAHWCVCVLDVVSCSPIELALILLKKKKTKVFEMRKTVV